MFCRWCVLSVTLNRFVQQYFGKIGSTVVVLSRKFAAGLIGGMVGVVFATPFDVVKSRMQNQLSGQPRIYTGVASSLYRILTREGMAALYKGFFPRLVRLGPGGGIMIVAFDFFANLLHPR